MRVHHENPYAEYTIDGQRIDRDQDMTDQQLFFRAMASPKGVSTKDKYLERIATREAGILVKKGKNKNSNDDYYIYETTYEPIFDKDEANHNVPRIDWSEWHNGTGHVFLFSGRMPNKKRYYQLEAPNFDKARCYHVPEDVIIAYKNDKRRNEKSDLLAKFGTPDAMKMPVGQGLPCFFTLTNRQVESFGASLFIACRTRVPWPIAFRRQFGYPTSQLTLPMPSLVRILIGAAGFSSKTAICRQGKKLLLKQRRNHRPY